MDFKNQLKDYYEREKQVIDSLNYDEINAAMNAILDAYDREATIYIFGNGGSASTASHMICDLNKGICHELDKRFRAVCLNDNMAILMAVANDESYENVFYYQLENKLKKEDLVIAISGSGNSKNVVKAVDYVKKVGATLITMTGYSGGKIYEKADFRLHVPVDDMQIVEDIHMSFNHAIMQILWKHLSELNGKETIYRINQ